MTPFQARSSTQKLHAFLAHAGIASRRACEELVAKGLVSVNGQVVKNVATRIDPQQDKVTYQGKVVSLADQVRVTYLVYKPLGYLSSIGESKKQKSVVNIVPRVPRVYVADGLEEHAEGLVVLTNDTHMVRASSRWKHSLELLIQGAPSNTSLQALRKRLHTEDGVSVLRHEGGNTWISVSGIPQQQMRVLRGSCSDVGMQVITMVRTRCGPFALGERIPGKYRKAAVQELREVA